MTNQLEVTGMILQCTAIGESDRRVLLLTRELGKISAFAKGSRRPNSHLGGMITPFIFGVFKLYVGKSSYTLTSVKVSNYFSDLREDLIATCYGMYFLDLADYYTSEGNDESAMLKLLYQTCRALTHDSYKRELIRCIFEWKAFAINGVAPPASNYPHAHDSTKYTLDFITYSPIERLYSFQVTDEVLQALQHIVQAYGKKQYDRPFKSLEVLNQLIE